MESLEDTTYNPEKALSIAKEIWNEKLVTTELLSREILFGKNTSITNIGIIRVLMVKVGAHLVEAYRTSPRRNCNGSYAEARKKIIGLTDFVKIHDLIHVVVAWQRRKSSVPLFLAKEKNMIDDLRPRRTDTPPVISEEFEEEIAAIRFPSKENSLLEFIKYASLIPPLE